MKDLYQIQKITSYTQEINSPIQMKFINDKKGRGIFINSLQSLETMAILEFIPNAGIRGNHYHLNKKEIIYIIDGIMKLYLWVPNEKKTEEIIVESGDLITIEPNLGHAFSAVQRTLAFELSDKGYDSAGTVYDNRIE